MGAHDGVELKRQLTFEVAFRQIIFDGDNTRASAEERQQLYSAEAYLRFVGVSGGRAVLSTERDAGLISLDLEIRTQPPDGDNIQPWDCVAEVSLVVNDPELVIYTPPGDEDELYRFPLRPDTYRMRVYVGGVETVNALGTEGEDHYRVVLWPAPYQEPVTLHKRVRRRFEQPIRS